MTDTIIRPAGSPGPRAKPMDPKRRRPGGLHRRLLPYLLVLPATIMIGIFVVLSLVYTFRSSFTNWDAARLTISWVGWNNFKRLFKDDQFVSSLWHSAVFVIGVVVISVVAGVLIAVMLNFRFRGRTAVRVIVMVPWILSEIAVGVVWTLILAPDGVFATVLKHLGIDINPLGGSVSAMIFLILVESWRSIGLVTVIVLASLQTINPDLYEAASLDGASARQSFFKITLPLLRSTVTVVSVLLLIGNFNIVSLILSLTAGGPTGATTTTALYMYKESFVYFHFGYASAVAVAMSVINVIALVIMVAVGGRKDYSE